MDRATSVPTHPYDCIPYVYIYTVHQLSPPSTPQYDLYILIRHFALASLLIECFANRTSLSQFNVLSKPAMCYTKHLHHDSRGVHRHQCISHWDFELTGQRVFKLSLLGCAVDYVPPSISQGDARFRCAALIQSIEFQSKHGYPQALRALILVLSPV